ncbi:hypothetical protein B0H13DRAFT_2310234 [Mycena leptocephala]|nr:hypothetical protein B0H13DRAFT_2310234 [Mycena leptocephala]
MVCDSAPDTTEAIIYSRYHRSHYSLSQDFAPAVSPELPPHSRIASPTPHADKLLRHPVTIISDLLYRFELRLCLLLPSLTSGLGKTSFDCSQPLLVLCSHGSGRAINASTSVRWSSGLGPLLPPTRVISARKRGTASSLWLRSAVVASVLRPWQPPMPWSAYNTATRSQLPLQGRAPVAPLCHEGHVHTPPLALLAEIGTDCSGDAARLYADSKS